MLVSRATLLFIILLSFLFFSFLAIPVNAAPLSPNPDIGCTVSVAGFDGVPSFGCLAQVIVNVIQWAYGFSLLAAMGYFIFGGITFMMAQDDKGIKSGRDKLVWAVLGFVFIVISFLLVRVIFMFLGLPDIINNFSLFVPKK
jgi:hypothetical protein